MPKNNIFIVNREILPKGKRGGIDWFNTKEIEIYFTDDEKNYILKVEDVIKDKGIVKILLSYDNIKYKKYLQVGQVSNGNLEHVFNYYNIRGNALRPFKLSDDGTYWIGITNKGKEFYFNGKHSEEIMKHNWYVNNGYILSMFKIGEEETYKMVRLNRMVLGIINPNIVVNHCGGNKMDNRVEMLSMSDHKDNMKELLPSVRNNTGITGLTKIENNTYRIQSKVNGFSYTGKYNTKEEALIDLLIIQRNYNYRHNENFYYMLDDIDNEYINKLIETVEENIKNRKVNPIINKNKFELSEDGSFYWMYDKNNNRCKISAKDLELVKQGNWRLFINNGKEYFSGEIICDGKRKGIFLHRFLMDLIDPKYRHWYIDHFDGSGLNNTRENIVITDAQGNGLNKKGENITLRKNRYECVVRFYSKCYRKGFYVYEEAVAWRDNILKELMKNRLEFKSKKELDEYINKSNMKNNELV